MLAQNQRGESQCLYRLSDILLFFVSFIDGNKQIARAKAVQAEFIRRAQAAATEGRKAADILAEGAIVGVGLIQRDEQQDSKKH